jgi:hypothetical protein
VVNADDTQVQPGEEGIRGADGPGYLQAARFRRPTAGKRLQRTGLGRGSPTMSIRHRHVSRRSCSDSIGGLGAYRMSRSGPSSVFNTQPEASDLPLAMRQILLRAAVLLLSFAIGLLIAAWIVPGVSLSVPGFIVAVVVFSVAQAILSLPMLKLPRQYASLLLGGTGLVLTIVALILASVLTHGITIDGMAPWVATTVVVWLVTTIGAITLPELLIRDDSGST